MLGVILFILKLLGFLLLAVVCLVILILCLVLLAPVRYTGQGCKYEEEFQVKALITYLNPAIRVLISYPDNSIIQVKLAGFTVFRIGKEKEEPHEKTKKQKSGKKSGSFDASGEQSVPGDGPVSKAEGKEKIHAPENTFSEKNSEEDKQCFEKERNVKQPESDKQQTGAEQSDIQPEQQSDAPKDPADRELKSEKASDTSKEQMVSDNTKNSSLDTVRYYASLLQENKELILRVLKLILNALKTILPRKCNIDITFGTGQADTTGFIYAAYCSLQDYLPGRIIFTPIWTESYLEGEFMLKGRIQVIHFVTAAVKIISNKDVRLLYKKIRRV